MRTALLLAWLALATVVMADVVEITTSNGSKVKGKVISKTADEIVFQSDFGTHRVQASSLSPESRAALGLGGGGDPAMVAEIARLRARVAELEEENRRLRSMGQSAPAPASAPAPFYGGGSAGIAQPSAQTQPTTQLRHSVSSTGKRHNSRCRYFGSGRPAGPSDGIACKICGG